jgi:LysR family transcriptional activator of glutamate synthase operon
MELRQLVTFAAVARHGGFTSAAGHLHLAQSAVSAQIRALETEVGAALFTRTTRRVALTQAGELLLARTHRILAELHGARGDLADLAAVLRGRVTIGATAVLGGYDLPAALAGFHQRFPGVAVSLRAGLIGPLLQSLDEAGAELVIGPVHDDLPARYAAHLVATEDLVVVLPPGHPNAAAGSQAGSARLSLADLRDETFICLSPDSGLRQILDVAAAAAGFIPQVQFETHSAADIRALVAAGLGVALMAASAARSPGPPVVVRSPEPPVAHPPIGVIHHRDRRLSPAARACRGHLIDLAKP